LGNMTKILIAVALVAAVCVGGGLIVLSNEKDTNISVVGSTTVQPLMVSFQEEYEKHHNVTLNVSGGGSGAAAPAVRNGTADIGMLSRNPNAGEADLKHIVIAGDAVVIVVNKSANIANLTLEQVAKIYSGEYTNWNQVGGGAGPIHPIIREDGSGTRECLDTIMKTVHGFSDSKYRSYPSQASTNSMLSQVKNVSGAIGYINLGAVTTMDKDTRAAVSIVSIGGVAPSAATVTDGTYKISRNLVLITDGDPVGEVKAFLDWIKSPRGQRIVEKEGFVPIGPTA